MSELGKWRKKTTLLKTMRFRKSPLFWILVRIPSSSGDVLDFLFIAGIDTSFICSFIYATNSKHWKWCPIVVGMGIVDDYALNRISWSHGLQLKADMWTHKQWGIGQCGSLYEEGEARVPLEEGRGKSFSWVLKNVPWLDKTC